MPLAGLLEACTGVESLREPYKPLVVNVRASYYEETEAMVEHLTKDLGASKIAIMYQDDAFGQAGLAGVKKALEKRKMELAAEGTFERNTTAVKGALLTIRKAEPDAVIVEQQSRVRLVTPSDVRRHDRSPLGDRVAVHAVCRENVFWETLEDLKGAGATSVLVLPVEKMLA